jgi:CheY-like chemotaxis protein
MKGAAPSVREECNGRRRRAGNRRLVQSILSIEGYVCSDYSNAEDAMRALKDDARPDVVLVDLQLPGRTGIGFAAR